MLEAIRESKVHAERIAKAKSTFLSNMSHEIRTPLNVILGLTEILQKTKNLDEKLIRKNLHGIDFSAKNLLSIVNDILDFSKIEAGKLSLQSIDFNLRKVVENLADGFSIKAKEKGLELHATIEENVPDIVIGDQYRLNQILNNLISNAIKFTKHGNIGIAIKLLKQNENDLVLQFMVTDTGIGISSENLKKIFDSFYQVDNMENSGGTGLGLAITRELIYLHEGEFNAESELEKGSKFTFTIPYKKSSLISLADSSKCSVDSTKKLDGLKVLVAEDNEMNQFYIKQLLKKLNVEADIAENGKEAVDILKSKKDTYDLVLMDMHMPVMNGMEAISHIRKLNGTTVKKLPIVACSADVFPEARKNAIKAGIDFYLTKPLSEDAIKEVLYWLVSDKPEEGTTAPAKNLETRPNTDSHKSNIALNALLETFENDKEFVISLLEVFVKNTPEDYNNLRTCVDREYYARASELAHKLKSSFMNLGMITHGHHLQQIETLLLSKKTVSEGLRHLATFKTLYHKALLEVNLLLIELRQK
ncbi:ATP-binding protein [Halomarinibacterium sedimenti]|nr:ATP-binding protein [Halomarinibacterium sedimenti]